MLFNSNLLYMLEDIKIFYMKCLETTNRYQYQENIRLWMELFMHQILNRFRCLQEYKAKSIMTRSF